MRSTVRIGAANARIRCQNTSCSGFVWQRASEPSQWPLSLPSTAFASRRNASGKFTEGLRKRIWGTEEPLGQEDPYGDKSLLDRTKEKEAAEERSEETPDTEPITSRPRGRDLGDDYVPATSIADLAHLPPAHEMAPFHGFVVLNVHCPTFTKASI